MSSNSEEVHISSQLFGLLFPKVITGTSQLMLDMLTSRAHAAVQTLQSRYERGLYNGEYEIEWLTRMVNELVSILLMTFNSIIQCKGIKESGASLLGQCSCKNLYLCISPFYKCLSVILCPRLLHPFQPKSEMLWVN